LRYDQQCLPAEEEAGFVKALITGMVDLHLLPQGMRRLDAV
jgi:hypothetical protein